MLYMPLVTVLNQISRVASFSHSFDSMSVEEKRSALRLFIDKVVWNGKTVDLYLMGTSDTSLSKVSEPLQRGSQS